MKTLVQMVEAFRIHEPRYVLPNMFTADLSTMVNPMSALSRGGGRRSSSGQRTRPPMIASVNTTRSTESSGHGAT